MGIAVTVNWVFNTLVVQFYLPLKEYFGMGTVFAGLAGLYSVEWT
jgi:hypothetical protein